jgi:Asp-tRNA(Asn)/Glu-tRNA(Gln) amidotransferase A subunit family amidase
MKSSALAIGVVLLATVSSGCAPGSAQRSEAGSGPFQIMETSIDAIHEAYRAGTLTARQLVQMYLDRIEAYDKNGPTLNSIITISPQALQEADQLDAQYKASGPAGPLHGIPILVKDEIDTAGMPTTLGTLVFKDYRPPLDAFAIAQLRKAGAIILGKTTLSEFAGGDTYGSMFGVTRNPYALDRTAGGSSGGSGAALAANLTTLAIGEETASSIRRPGGWNAVVALRPTPGLVSRSGMWDGYPRPQAQMGPMARTVRDLATLLDGMVGYDPEDPLTALGVGHAPESYTQSLDENGLKGARIGVLREAMGRGSDPTSDDFKKVEAVLDRNVAELKAAGAVVVDPVVIPDLKKLLAIRGAHNESSDEALRIYLARNPNSPFKTREDIANSPDMDKSVPPTKAVQWRTPRNPTDLTQYARSLEAREQLMINVAKVMADHQLDAIVYKTVEHQPTPISEGINPPYRNGSAYLSPLNTFLVYTAVITVPAGFTSDNLPAGLTFFGLAYSEPQLIKLAYAFEQATHHRRPPDTTPALTPPTSTSATTSRAPSPTM